jgi:hypothetical protein
MRIDGCVREEMDIMPEADSFSSKTERIPLIDRIIPPQIETATFALG